MTAKVMIVEDEMLVACHLESVVEDLGFEPVGIAADTAQARELGERRPDIALVDLNLRDGPTGPAIGAWLGELGVTVVFVTANPSALGRGVPGALGVMGKPCDDEGVFAALDFAARRRRGEPAPPPAGLVAFA